MADDCHHTDREPTHDPGPSAVLCAVPRSPPRHPITEGGLVMSQRSPYRTCQYCLWRIDTDDRRAWSKLRRHIEEDHAEVDEALMQAFQHWYCTDPVTLGDVQ